MPAHDFFVGQLYNRRTDIHGRYRGQQQGGISTPAGHPLVFAFTGDAGNAYGYRDGFQADGTFWYTGEGQVGDMEMIRGNLAIRDHLQGGKQLLLFEYAASGVVRFIGSAECLGHHIEERPDRTSELRNAIVFHLALEADSKEGGAVSPYTSPLSRQKLAAMSLDQLREVAMCSTPAAPSLEQKMVNVRIRSEAVREYALKRSRGTCEGCHTSAPFLSRHGPFLEVHHMLRLSDGGPDHPENVAALCPNCHRKAHYAVNATVFNQGLIEVVRAREVAQGWPKGSPISKPDA